MTYRFDFDIVMASIDLLLLGCLQTLKLTMISGALALVIAVIVSYLRQRGSRPVKLAARTYVEIIRNTPFLVQIFIIYFGLPALGIRFDPETAAVVGLAINGGAYTSEIIRGGIDSVPKGQFEAGLALALTPLQVFRYVIIVPALRAVYPAIGSQFILLLLTSSIVSSISVNELTQAAQHIESQSFRSFEVYFIVTLLYLAMTLIVSGVFRSVFKLCFRYPT